MAIGRWNLSGYYVGDVRVPDSLIDAIERFGAAKYNEGKAKKADKPDAFEHARQILIKDVFNGLEELVREARKV